MKKQLIFGSLLALSGIANAQGWNTGGPLNTTNNIGIGATGTLVKKLEIESATADDGIRIKQTGSGAALLQMNNTTSGGREWAILATGSGNNIGSGHFAIYDVTAATPFDPRFFIHGPSGNTGIGTTSPGTKLSVASSTFDDGINISQTGSGASVLFMTNSTSGGRQWRLLSTGTGNSQGTGNFSIYDNNSSSDRLFIEGSSGNVGVGLTNPSARLHAETTDNVAVQGDANPTSGGATGVNGRGVGVTPASGFAYGVAGEASNAFDMHGGHFTAIGASSSTYAYGIYASTTNYANDLAGYFNGDVKINGAGYITTAWSVSDKKLKKEIKPLTNGLEKIKLLKPSTYLFRADEFKTMNLPKENQLGLIAQELEEVFPELVKESAESHQTDKDGKITGTVAAHKTVNYTGLIPVLIAGVQEQQATIESQQKTIDQQSQINADLQKQLDEQKQLINGLAQKATGVNSIGNVETGFRMSQNEPNPFTHETLVKYTLPQSVASAFMAVYDLTGKQITTFPIQEKGSSSITITSEKLAAGIYIYSIVADGKVVDSKRMIVAEK